MFISQIGIYTLCLTFLSIIFIYYEKASLFVTIFRVEFRKKEIFVLYLFYFTKNFKDFSYLTAFYNIPGSVEKKSSEQSAISS